MLTVKCFDVPGGLYGNSFKEIAEKATDLIRTYEKEFGEVISVSISHPGGHGMQVMVTVTFKKT